MSSDTKDVIEITYWSVSLVVLCITAIYVATSPVRAVRIGRDLNDEQNKYITKRNLFLTLFSYRGTPVHYSFVNGLNQIDVVFHDTQPVLNAWHKYYESLNQKGLINELEIREQNRVEILSAMAVELGYGKLSQVDILKNYYPERHDKDDKFENDLKEAALNYFQAGFIIYEEMIHNMKDNKQETDHREKESL